MDGEMLISAEDRVAYWGYRHMNISCRDINDEEEPDLVGLERILYGVGFLAVTNLQGISAWDEEPAAAEEEEEVEVDYEAVDSAFNPFDYEVVEDEIITPMYPSLEEGVDPFAALFDDTPSTADEDGFLAGEDDSEDMDEQPAYLVLESELKKAA
jgi:hypothetical protein